MSLIQTAFKQLIKTVFLQSVRKHLKIETFSSEARWSNESCLFSGTICPSRGAFAAFERRTFHLDSIRFSKFQDCMEYFSACHHSRFTEESTHAVWLLFLLSIQQICSLHLLAPCPSGACWVGAPLLFMSQKAALMLDENFAITKSATRDS